MKAALLALALVACPHDEPLRDPARVVATGAQAPDGTLTGPTGSPVTLSDAWRGHAGAVVVFYRGFY